MPSTLVSMVQLACVNEDDAVLTVVYSREVVLGVVDDSEERLWMCKLGTRSGACLRLGVTNASFPQNLLLI